MTLTRTDVLLMVRALMICFTFMCFSLLKVGALHWRYKREMFKAV